MSKRETQTYTPEYRTEAIKLVLEQGLSVTEVAARLNMNHGTLAYWATQARKGLKPVASVAGAQSAGRGTNGARHIKKGDGVLCQGVTARYAFVKQWRLDYPVKKRKALLPGATG